MDENDERFNLLDFFGIMEQLMAPDGCPWDSVQTHDSIKMCIAEEAYEVIDAIDRNDMPNLREELGDVLLQVVFHSILAEKEGKFNFDDVVDEISQKMIRRHPHIFSNDFEKTDWESIKKAEKGYKNNTEAIKAIPKAMPALMRGQKIISKSRKFGYRDEEEYDPYKNIEIALKTLKTGAECDKMENIGNILFDILKICVNNEINAEYALTKALEKGINRFDNFENKK